MKNGQYSISINVIGESLTGHANITFNGPNINTTIGANQNKLTYGILSTTFGPVEGIYVIEDSLLSRNHITTTYTTTQAQFNLAYSYASKLVGTSFNYGFGAFCTEFIGQIYSMTRMDGYPKQWGALFTTRDAFKMNGLPVISQIPGWPDTSGFNMKDLGTAPECFLAGTPVDMWDGTQKPIEQIRPDDMVVSYDRDGKLVPGRVARTFENRARHILDVHGLMMTPGHVTYCAGARRGCLSFDPDFGFLVQYCFELNSIFT